MSRHGPRRAHAAYLNGKWLAQAPSGTQRYATQVARAISTTRVAGRITLVLPKDASPPSWAGRFRIVRSRLRGALFEQVALPWIARRGHLYSLAGPAPLLKCNQTIVMHDATPFRYPSTYRRLFVLWYQILYRVLSRTAARVLTVSAFSRSELAQVLSVPEDRFDLAPCGSDHVEEPREVRDEELPWPRGSYALLVGNLAPHKNIHAVVVALADAGIPVAVVGGEQRQVFRDTAAPEHPNVRLLGRVDDARLAALYAGAGVFVMPSRYEGFGIPIVEAGRLGCPSVYARGSALTEVAGDGGLGFNPDDVRSCVELVAGLLRDSLARAELAQRARRNAERFTWARTAQTVFQPERPSMPATSSSADSGHRDASGRRLRVLHVTETFAAGTGLAVVSFARATRDQGIESFLLAQDRDSGLLEELREDSPFLDARILPSGLIRLRRGVDAAIRDLRPDIVHVHSSVAGAVVRLRASRSGAPPIVYSPHCFAFERRDVSSLRRAAFRTAERLLSWRTAAFVCVSPHEADLAERLNGKALVRYLVNSTLPVNSTTAKLGSGEAEGAVRLVSAGRLTSQKDPVMFAAVVTALRAAGIQVEATWIGAGDDPRARAALERADVRVTGWVPSQQVPARLAEHTVYLHTAAWEAASPIAVLDAMAAGLAVVVRNIEAYRGLLPPDWLFGDVSEAVEMILGLRSRSVRADRIRDQFATLAKLERQGPDAVLAEVYREVCARRSA